MKARSLLLPCDFAAATLTKRGYFKGIKAAKAVHWRSLLVSATPSSIWTLKKLLLGKPSPRFPSLLDATILTQINHFLLNYLFPPQPLYSIPAILRPYEDCSELTPEEISTTPSKCSPSSPPGPDTILYSVGKKLYRCAPVILTSLMGPPLRHGHHPSSLKKANGVVLDKPGKPSYDSRASFRIIVLLQPVLNILERIVALHLSAIARHVGLLLSPSSQPVWLPPLPFLL